MDNILWLLFGLILGIPFSVFANIATPWVKSFWDKGSLSLRERQLYVIWRDYHLVTAIRFDTSYAVRYGFYHLASIVYMIAIILSLGILFLFPGALSRFSTLIENDVLTSLLMLSTIFLITMIVTSVVLPFLFSFYKAMTYDNYEEKMKRTYKKLGGNLEDLEAIDKNYNVKQKK